MPYLRRDLGLASLVLGSRYRAHTGQFTRTTPVLGSELASMSAIADERSESEVAAEIGHSQSTERAIARSVTVITLRNPANTPCDLG